MNSTKSKLFAPLLAFAMLLPAFALAPKPAEALTLGFYCLTGNLASDCAIGEAQLSVDVDDLGGGQVSFTFNNAGPDTAAISEIYFDDGTLLGIASVTAGPGVMFVPGADPMDLPGGNLADPDFMVTSGFLAEASAPPPMNGVGPGEWVTIVYDLQAGGDFADVLDELTTGALRIGLHVIGFDSGGSDSFVNDPVPEPGTALLMGLGLLAMGRMRR